MGMLGGSAKALGESTFDSIFKNIGRIGYADEKISSKTFRRGKMRVGAGLGLGFSAGAYARHRSSARDGLQGRSSGGYR